jgi:hypothetical protein
MRSIRNDCKFRGSPHKTKEGPDGSDLFWDGGFTGVRIDFVGETSRRWKLAPDDRGQQSAISLPAQAAFPKREMVGEVWQFHATGNGW